MNGGRASSFHINPLIAMGIFEGIAHRRSSPMLASARTQRKTDSWMLFFRGNRPRIALSRFGFGTTFVQGLVRGARRGASEGAPSFSPFLFRRQTLPLKSLISEAPGVLDDDDDRIKAPRDWQR
jgi:hypothetical protein